VQQCANTNQPDLHTLQEGDREDILSMSNPHNNASFP